MLAGARLREAGIDDFKIIEKGGDFGGTCIGIDVLALLVISSPTFTFSIRRNRFCPKTKIHKRS